MPTNQKRFTITLNAVDLGQLLDGLRIRAESWRATAHFFESGYAEDDFMCEHCNDAYEATHIAAHYDRLIAEIQHSIDEQGGW